MRDNAIITIVEDDPRISRILRRYLVQSGYNVNECQNFKALQRELSRRTPDCVLLDLHLPDAHGLEIARMIRSDYPEMGLIIITGSGDLTDKIVALEVGADDYVTKPFEEREVLARLRSVMRRRVDTGSNTAAGGVARFGDFELNFDAHSLTKCGKDVNLTSREFRLLSYLVRAGHRVLSRDQILEELAGRDWEPNDRSVDMLVGRIRKKIEDDPKSPVYIKTMRGSGYIFTGIER